MDVLRTGNLIAFRKAKDSIRHDVELLTTVKANMRDRCPYGLHQNRVHVVAMSGEYQEAPRFVQTRCLDVEGRSLALQEFEGLTCRFTICLQHAM